MRYFFDLFDGDHWTRDDLGLDCRSEHDARYQAILGLTDMARELLPFDGDVMALRVRIRHGSNLTLILKLDFEVERP